MRWLRKLQPDFIAFCERKKDRGRSSWAVLAIVKDALTISFSVSTGLPEVPYIKVINNFNKMSRYIITRE